AALIEAMDKACSALLDQRMESYLDAFRRDCVNLGREIQLINQGNAEIVTALDIDEQFHLLVRDAAGQERTIWSGEVSIRGIGGYTDGGRI
ncbi:MAG: biotin--[Oscillibacter sp.]|nr:biotin--[acetyl-CoA-carboxylase] ligase [Oscillibacter sp.]